MALAKAELEYPEGHISRSVVGGDYIMTKSRIGLVHTALAHSQEDF